MFSTKSTAVRALFLALIAVSPYWLSQNSNAQNNDFQPASQQFEPPAPSTVPAVQEATDQFDFAPDLQITPRGPLQESIQPAVKAPSNKVNLSLGISLKGTSSTPQCSDCPECTVTDCTDSNCASCTNSPPNGKESPQVRLASFSAEQESNSGPVYQLDNDHTSLVFAVGHGNFSFVYGRFNRCWGRFWLNEEDPTKSRFEFSVDAASIDTNNEERDKHLRGPDFFNVQQSPMIKFKSNSVSLEDDTYIAKGTLDMLGQQKEFQIPFRLIGKGKGVFGKERAGFFAKFPIKRSDFGMNKMLASGVGNNIAITFSFEGIKETIAPKEARNIVPSAEPVIKPIAAPLTPAKPATIQPTELTPIVPTESTPVELNSDASDFQESSSDELQLGEIPESALDAILNLPDSPSDKK